MNYLYATLNDTTEVVYVHTARHNPRANSTKVWI